MGAKTRLRAALADAVDQIDQLRNANDGLRAKYNLLADECAALGEERDAAIKERDQDRAERDVAGQVRALRTDLLSERGNAFYWQTTAEKRAVDLAAAEARAVDLTRTIEDLKLKLAALTAKTKE